jgi:hypothetical protein
MTRRPVIRADECEEFFITFFPCCQPGRLKKESGNSLPIAGRIHVGADHADMRECVCVSGKRLNVLKADDQATGVRLSNMEDPSFRKAADKASFLLGSPSIRIRLSPDCHPGGVVRIEEGSGTDRRIVISPVAALYFLLP